MVFLKKKRHFSEVFASENEVFGYDNSNTGNNAEVVYDKEDIQSGI